MIVMRPPWDACSPPTPPSQIVSKTQYIETQLIAPRVISAHQAMKPQDDTDLRRLRLARRVLVDSLVSIPALSPTLRQTYSQIIMNGEIDCYPAISRYLIMNDDGMSIAPCRKACRKASQCGDSTSFISPSFTVIRLEYMGRGNNTIQDSTLIYTVVTRHGVACLGQACDTYATEGQKLLTGRPVSIVIRICSRLALGRAPSSADAYVSLATVRVIGHRFPACRSRHCIGGNHSDAIRSHDHHDTRTLSDC